MRRSQLSRSFRGFSLVEILVVIAMIGILAGLILVGTVAMENKSISLVDASTHNDLVKANIAHTADHNGRWLNPMTSGDSDTWVDCGGNNLIDGVEQPGSLRQGEAWAYIGNLATYKSPEDKSARIRSYSYNAQVGVRWDGYHTQQGYGPGTQTMGTVPMPSSTMLTVSEHSEYGYNPQGFYVGFAGSSWEGCWVDFPAYHNPMGVNIGYVDGSVRFYTFADPNLSEMVTHAYTWGVEGPDLDFFASIMLPGWDREW